MAPYDAFVIGELAVVPIMSGKPDKALEWIDFALARDPNASKDLNYKRGWALRLLGKYEDSLAAFKQAYTRTGTLRSIWPSISFASAGSTRPRRR